MSRMDVVLFTTVLLAFAGVLVVPAQAQETDNSMVKTTTKGSLDIRLEPIESPSQEVRYRVSFLNPGTDTLHEHQDYDFRIIRDGQELYSAAKQLNQPLIHNVEGTITVPYNFSETGDYTIEIQILGLGFGPTLVPTDESASFSVVVTPEFPAGLVGMLTTAVGAAVMLTGKFRPA